MLDVGDIPFFSRLPAAALDEIRRLIEVRVFAPHAPICRKGDEGKFFYAIASGGVHVCLAGDGRESRVFLGPGEVFGEMSLLADIPISATVISANETHTLALSKQAFLHLLEVHPAIHQALLEMFVERLRHRSSEASSVLRPICCLFVDAIHQPSATDRQDQQQLLSALFAITEHYSPGSFLVHAHLGEDETALVLEASSARQAIASADRRPQREFAPAAFGEPVSTVSGGPWLVHLVEAWKNFGSADQVLLLVITPQDFSHVQSLLQIGDAVIVHANEGGIDICRRVRAEALDRAEFSIIEAGESGFPPRSACDLPWRFRIPKSDLLEELQQEHTRAKRPHLDWVARWITRREVGLALSAGAARGFAHLGVLQVLEEEGIPVDCVTGTSMGGIVALAYAVTGNARDATELIRSNLAGNRRVRDRAWFPRMSMLAGRKVRNAALNTFGDMEINDLSRPCMVIASDLVRGERVILDRGPVATAALATSSIPGIFPPIEVENRILVDGALVSRLPVDLLDLRRCALRIAVNVIPSPEARRANAAQTATWLRQRFSRFFGFRQVIGSAWELLGWYHGSSQAQRADILLEPDTELYSGYDFDSFDDMLEAGRRATQDKLELIRTAATMSLRPGTP